MKNVSYGAIEKDGRNRKEDTNRQKGGDEGRERKHKKRMDEENKKDNSKCYFPPHVFFALP